MRIHHLALRTADPARLTRFYADVLGLALVDHDADAPRAWLDAEGPILMIERADAFEALVPAGTKELLAFAVDDKEAWRARLDAAGVRVDAETTHTLYFRDPDGRRVAVSTYPLPR